MDREERHQIFKRELYPKAALPREDFLLELEEFRLNHPDLLPEEHPVKLDISQFKTFLKKRNPYK